jgi:hypothetical protein
MFEQEIAGEYNVSIPGKTVKISLSPGRTLAFQEGIGAFMDMVLTADGKIGRPDLFQKKLGFLDIGFKTVNFFAMDHGRFVDNMSGTLERLGMSDAYISFYKRITHEKGLKPSEAEVLFLEGKGQTECRDLAAKIEGQLAIWWPYPEDFDIIFLSGGGGLALKEWFLKYKVHPVLNSRTANASGFRKVAVSKLGVK